MGRGELGMNDIHPTAVIEDSVELGENNFIGPFCYFTGHLTIGDNNRFESHCAIGTRPEHAAHWHQDGRTIIGDDNMFREHVTIHGAMIDGLTRVGNNVIMLRHSHVAHNCIVENNVTLSVSAIMLGHVHVMKYSNCGTGCEVHQFQVVGSWAMVGMGCVVPKASRIKPYKVYVGNPARELRDNTYYEVTPEEVHEETVRWQKLLENNHV